ncbi:hypothetical protein [Actinoplanes sp. NPDC049265]|uniref:hypothetical protein n=1 Tax=Actinoplanes sp. NPDC049265 TaxID=3363902 RepID=UPI0037146CDA
MSNTTIRVLTALVVAGGLFATSGCGGGQSTDQSAPQVASVPEGAAGGGKPSAAATSDRPVDRADMSEEERSRLWTTWGRCLTEHGVPAPPPGKQNQSQDVLQKPESAKAVAACASKQPESEWDHAKRTDPDYATKFRALIQCIRDKGVSVEPKGEGPGYSLTDDRQITRGMEVADECDRKVLR